MDESADDGGVELSPTLQAFLGRARASLEVVELPVHRLAVVHDDREREDFACDLGLAAREVADDFPAKTFDDAVVGRREHCVLAVRGRVDGRAHVDEVAALERLSACVACRHSFAGFEHKEEGGCSLLAIQEKHLRLNRRWKR